LTIHQDCGDAFFGECDLAELVDMGGHIPVFVRLSAKFKLIAYVFGMILDHSKITKPYFLVIFYHILACLASCLWI
jgi:hypothetical protein